MCTRHNHSINEVHSRGLVVFGGRSSQSTCSNETYIYNEVDNSWSILNVESKIRARSKHLAVVIYETLAGISTIKPGKPKLLVAHGFDASGRKLNDIYSLDFEAMTWERYSSYLAELSNVTFTSCCLNRSSSFACVIFIGSESDSPISSRPKSAVDRLVVWEFNTVESKWAERSTLNGPCRRVGYCMSAIGSKIWM